MVRGDGVGSEQPYAVLQCRPSRRSASHRLQRPGPPGVDRCRRPVDQDQGRGLLRSATAESPERGPTGAKTTVHSPEGKLIADASAGEHGSAKSLVVVAGRNDLQFTAAEVNRGDCRRRRRQSMRADERSDAQAECRSCRRCSRCGASRAIRLAGLLLEKTWFMGIRHVTPDAFPTVAAI